LSDAERKRQRQTVLAERREELLNGLSQTDRSLVLAYIENAAQELKTGNLTLGGEVSRLEEIVAVRAALVGDDDQHGLDRWRHGMMEAAGANNRRGGVGVANPNYVKRCAEGWMDGDEEPRRNGGGFQRRPVYDADEAQDYRHIPAVEYEFGTDGNAYPKGEVPEHLRVPE
jgi:hypothetical protein